MFVQKEVGVYLGGFVCVQGGRGCLKTMYMVDLYLKIGSIGELDVNGILECI